MTKQEVDNIVYEKQCHVSTKKSYYTEYWAKTKFELTRISEVKRDRLGYATGKDKTYWILEGKTVQKKEELYKLLENM